jgi:uncharacterized membrane protein
LRSAAAEKEKQKKEATAEEEKQKKEAAAEEEKHAPRPPARRRWPASTQCGVQEGAPRPTTPPCSTSNTAPLPTAQHSTAQHSAALGPRWDSSSSSSASRWTVGAVIVVSTCTVPLYCTYILFECYMYFGH